MVNSIYRTLMVSTMTFSIMIISIHSKKYIVLIIVLTGGPLGPIGPTAPATPCSPCFNDKDRENVKADSLHKINFL